MKKLFSLVLGSAFVVMTASAQTAVERQGQSLSIGTGYLSTTQTAGTAGTTTNLAACFSGSTGTVVDCPTGAGGVGYLGIAVSTATSTNPVEVKTRGQATVVADGAITIGDLVGLGTTTGGRIKDLGQTATSAVDLNIQIVGRALTLPSPNSAGNTFTIQLYGPGQYGSQANTIDGVTLTGTPSLGQVPTATSPTAATWQTPSAGGSTFIDAQGVTGATTGNGTAQTVYSTASITSPGAGKCITADFGLLTNGGSSSVAMSFGGGSLGNLFASGVDTIFEAHFVLCNNPGVQTAQWWMVTGVAKTTTAGISGVSGTAAVNWGAGAQTLTLTDTLAGPNAWVGQGWMVAYVK